MLADDDIDTVLAVFVVAVVVVVVDDDGSVVVTVIVEIVVIVLLNDYHSLHASLDHYTDHHRDYLVLELLGVVQKVKLILIGQRVRPDDE